MLLWFPCLPSTGIEQQVLHSALHTISVISNPIFPLHTMINLSISATNFHQTPHYQISNTTICQMGYKLRQHNELNRSSTGHE